VLKVAISLPLVNVELVFDNVIVGYGDVERGRP